MARGWDPNLHPRGYHGRFTARLKPQFSQSVRLSPYSASYNAGVRLQVVPGRANLYVGALARIERVGGSNLFKRQTDSAVNAIARRFGDAGGRSNVAQLLKGNPINVKGLTVQGPARVIHNPTFRVSRTPGSRAAYPRNVRVRRPRVRNASPTGRIPHLTGSVRGTQKAALGASPRRRRRRRRSR